VHHIDERETAVQHNEEGTSRNCDALIAQSLDCALHFLQFSIDIRELPSPLGVLGDTRFQLFA
jgi:hypothetical protein